MFAHLLWCVCDELINECKPFCFDNVCVREGKKARKYLIIIITIIIINPFDEEQMNGRDGKNEQEQERKIEGAEKTKEPHFPFFSILFLFLVRY